MRGWLELMKYLWDYDRTAFWGDVLLDLLAAGLTINAIWEVWHYLCKIW